MAEDLIDSGALGRIVVQNLGDEVARRICYSYVFGEVVSVHANALISGLDIAGLKWRLSNNQRVDNDTDRPDVNLIGVTLFALEHFGRNIVGCAADGSLSFTIELQLCCQTEIADFHFHLVIYE